MAIRIRKGEGHYFQYAATTSNAPSLSVKAGEVLYWIQQGPANATGLMQVERESVVGGQTVPLPIAPQEDIFTLFVIGKDKSEYEFHPGGVSISSVTKKRLAELPTGLVEKSFGTFAHRAESTYE